MRLVLGPDRQRRRGSLRIQSIDLYSTYLRVTQAKRNHEGREEHEGQESQNEWLDTADGTSDHAIRKIVELSPSRSSSPSW